MIDACNERKRTGKEVIARTPALAAAVSLPLFG